MICVHWSCLMFQVIFSASEYHSSVFLALPPSPRYLYLVLLEKYGNQRMVMRRKGNEKENGCKQIITAWFITHFIEY